VDVQHGFKTVKQGGTKENKVSVRPSQPNGHNQHLFVVVGPFTQTFKDNEQMFSAIKIIVQCQCMLLLSLGMCHCIDVPQHFNFIQRLLKRKERQKEWTHHDHKNIRTIRTTAKHTEDDLS
jgi:hypothetical protein